MSDVVMDCMLIATTGKKLPTPTHARDVSWFCVSRYTVVLRSMGSGMTYLEGSQVFQLVEPGVKRQPNKALASARVLQPTSVADMKKLVEKEGTVAGILLPHLRATFKADGLVVSRPPKRSLPTELRNLLAHRLFALDKKNEFIGAVQVCMCVHVVMYCRCVRGCLCKQTWFVVCVTDCVALICYCMRLCLPVRQQTDAM